VRVHLARKHALEFELLDLRRQAIDVIRHGECRTVVVLRLGEFEQLVGPAQPFAERADAVDDAIELRAFLAELLSTLGIVPDIRIFELAPYFLEPFALGLVVKDTP